MLKLFKIIKPYRIVVAFILVLIFLQSLAELYLPTIMADIVDTGIVRGDISYIIKMGVVMLLVAAGGTVCAFVASFSSAKISAKFGQLLRGRVFAHVEEFSLQEFDNLGTASLINRATNDITQVQQLLTMMLRMMVRAPMMCAGGIIMAVSKDAGLSLVIVAVIPILVASVYVVMAKSMPLYKAMQAKLDKLNLVLRENLTGVRVIRAFNRAVYEQERFDAANLDLTGTAIKVNKVMATMMPLMMLVLNFSIIGIIWFGSLRIEHGGIQVGDLMAFIQYAMQILFALMMFSMMIVMIPRASVSAARINEVLDTAPVIRDTAGAGKAGIPDCVTQFEQREDTSHQSMGTSPPTGNVTDGISSKREMALLETIGSSGVCIKFINVTFSYPGAEKPALANISFTAEPGEVTAIIGGTGSGKSTLVNLIPRFYDVDSGGVLVDGVDVRQWLQSDLRAKIGLVPQKAMLFSGTVADNIRYGKEDATDQEIWRAARVAQAASFIADLKDGFDTVIAQGGTNVSGGQKQRLTIARALVRRPMIYLFDDSFSALDFKTDAELRAALRKETAGATVLMVTQRVSTVLNADKIIVLDKGRIAGLGKHRQLMETCEVYREIVSSQLAGGNWHERRSCRAQV